MGALPAMSAEVNFTPGSLDYHRKKTASDDYASDRRRLEGIDIRLIAAITEESERAHRRRAAIPGVSSPTPRAPLSSNHFPPFRRLAEEILGAQALIRSEELPVITRGRVAHKPGRVDTQNSYVLHSAGVLSVASGLLCALGCALHKRFHQAKKV